MEPDRIGERQIDMSEEHRYAGALESPPGCWFVRCACGWSMRMLASNTLAKSEYLRHEQGMEWWES